MNRNKTVAQQLVVAVRDVNFQAVAMLSALGLLGTMLLPNSLGLATQLLQASL